MTRPSTDHVTVSFDSGEIRCGHCADFHAPNCEIPAAILMERLRGFLLMHRLCPKPEAPSPQMALPGTEHLPFDEEDCRLAGIPAPTDEPAPEIDPPGPYARFEEMYPLAENMADLLMALGEVLPMETLQPLTTSTRVNLWHPASGIFNAVANWARIEKAHADAYAEAQRGEPAKGGLTIPRREPMPEKLAELLGVKAKEKRGALPLTSPKRKRKEAP